MRHFVESAHHHFHHLQYVCLCASSGWNNKKSAQINEKQQQTHSILTPANQSPAHFFFFYCEKSIWRQKWINPSILCHLNANTKLTKPAQISSSRGTERFKRARKYTVQLVSVAWWGSLLCYSEINVRHGAETVCRLKVMDISMLSCAEWCCTARHPFLLQSSCIRPSSTLLMECKYFISRSRTPSCSAAAQNALLIHPFEAPPMPPLFDIIPLRCAHRGAFLKRPCLHISLHTHLSSFSWEKRRHMHRTGTTGKCAAVCAAFPLVVCRYSGGYSHLALAFFFFSVLAT